LPDRSEDGEGLLGSERRIRAGPVVLIERLDYVMGFGHGVAEADGEDELAVGEMAEDFLGAPFAGGRGAVEVRDLGGEGLELRWGFGDYGFRVTGS